MKLPYQGSSGSHSEELSIAKSDRAAGKPLGRTAIGVEEDTIPCDFSITSVARTGTKHQSANRNQDFAVKTTFDAMKIE